MMAKKNETPHRTTHAKILLFLYYLKKTTLMAYMEQIRLSAALPLHTHLCLVLRIHFLLSEQIQAGCHDDVRSLLRSVWKDATVINQPTGSNLTLKGRTTPGHFSKKHNSS